MPMGYVWSLLSHIQPRATASPNLLLCLDFWILSTESLNLQWQNQFSDIHLASPSLAFSLQSIQSDIYSAMIPDWDCNTKRFWSGASAWHKTNTYLKKVNTYLKPKVLISPAFQSTHSESEWSRRDAISNLTNVRLKIFNSASFNVLFELDEPGFLSPLILRRADPADTQSRIWCTSGTDSGSEKGSTSAGRKRQVHRWSKSLGYRVTPHLKAVLSQTIIVTCCFI